MLDDVPGLGPTRRTRLLTEFGSVKRLRELTEDELVAIPWLPEPVGRATFSALHGGFVEPCAHEDPLRPGLTERPLCDEVGTR